MTDKKSPYALPEPLLKKMYATVSISKKELENSKIIEAELIELIAARIAKAEQAIIDEAIRIYLGEGIND